MIEAHMKSKFFHNPPIFLNACEERTLKTELQMKLLLNTTAKY